MQNIEQIKKRKNLIDESIHETVEGISSVNIKTDLSFESKDGRIFAGMDLKVPAGVLGTWKIKVTNTEKDIGEGGVFHFVVLNYSFQRVQKRKREQPGYTSLESDSDTAFCLIDSVPGFHNICRVLVESGIFRVGESFTVRLGDTRYGSPGSEVYWTATDAYLITEADIDGKGKLKPCKPGPLHFEVVHRDEVRLIRLLGPTVAKTGQLFDIHLGIFDIYGNVIENYEGEVKLEAADNFRDLPEKCYFKSTDKGIKILKDVSIITEGVYRIKACAKGSEDVFTGNPVVVMNEPEKYVFWGDLHAHGWGDRTMHLMHARTKKTDPLERHKQAFSIGRLDYSAVSPMSFPRMQREKVWQAYKEACTKLDNTGKYVPLLGYEAHPIEGDRDIFFKSLDEPIPPDYRIPMEELDNTYGSREDVIMEVHIGGKVPKWEMYQPQNERMVEVVSGFGNAEWLLVKALKTGLKPAVCGCSDLHLGLMGGPRTVETARGRFGKVMKHRDSSYGSGPLTAAVADKLDRENLWQSFLNRSTYATSGARMYLDFKCNNTMMGGVILRQDKINIQITCYGTSIINRIELIAGDCRIREWSPGKQDFEIETVLDIKDIPATWMYVRVDQVDNEYAWSSPVWIEYGYPKWNEDSDVFPKGTVKEAEFYLQDAKNHIEREEDLSLFSDIRPAGIVREQTASCAVFHCYYGKRKMTIKWYYEFELPKIRYDWGWRTFGIIDDGIRHNINF